MACAVRALLESVEFYPLFSVLNWLYLVKILIRGVCDLKCVREGELRQCYNKGRLRHCRKTRELRNMCTASPAVQHLNVVSLTRYALRFRF